MQIFQPLFMQRNMDNYMLEDQIKNYYSHKKLTIAVKNKVGCQSEGTTSRPHLEGIDLLPFSFVLCILPVMH